MTEILTLAAKITDEGYVPDADQVRALAGSFLLTRQAERVARAELAALRQELAAVIASRDHFRDEYYRRKAKQIARAMITRLHCDVGTCGGPTVAAKKSK